MKATLACLLGGLLATIPPTVAEEEDEQDSTRSTISPERLQKSIDDGLAFLDRMQTDRGSFDLGNCHYQAPTAVTALAALAFMGAGNADSRGPYSRNVREAIKFLIDACDTSQTERRGYIEAGGDRLSRMHGQGYATLALAEAYGMFGIGREFASSQKLRATLEEAVYLIEKTQGETGGWFYWPRATGDHENSITITLVQALRASRNAGIQVDPRVIDKAIHYIKRTQTEDGSFLYRLYDRDRRATFALTAAAVATLNALGEYDSEAIEKAMSYMKFQDPDLRARGRSFQHFPYYSRLYAAQAYWHYHDRNEWDNWFEKVGNDLLDRQEGDGSWPSPAYGPTYATAMTLLVLEIPLQYLPIFQR